MRRTLRHLANVKPAAAAATATAAKKPRYLEPGHPTGLVGIYTANSPRSTLLLLYQRTLEQLRKQFPETSVYRQSVEALTKHRMSIVEAAVPPGHKEWQVRAKEILKEQAGVDYLTQEASSAREGLGAGLDAVRLEAVGKDGGVFIRHDVPEPQDSRWEEWDGERDEGPNSEGLRGEDERGEGFAGIFAREPLKPQGKHVFEPEPQLTADQIEEIEGKIGAGLIEEVIEMAESELKLIDIMYRSKVWEPLEEKPVEGQWTYFERNSS